MGNEGTTKHLRNTRREISTEKVWHSLPHLSSVVLVDFFVSILLVLLKKVNVICSACMSSWYEECHLYVSPIVLNNISGTLWSSKLHRMHHNLQRGPKWLNVCTKTYFLSYQNWLFNNCQLHLRRVQFILNFLGY